MAPSSGCERRTCSPADVPMAFEDLEKVDRANIHEVGIPYHRLISCGSNALIGCDLRNFRLSLTTTALQLQSQVPISTAILIYSKARTSAILITHPTTIHQK